VRGVFITFEGVEGSGKSTQAKRLARDLEQRGIDCILSREPGGTGIGESIRSLLLDPDNNLMDARTELFLYLASRNQHVREKVLPAVREGKVVVLDRYAESSVAYQGGGRGLGEKLVSRLNRLATAALRPDLTILVDVPIAVGRKRKRTAELDRVEQERVEFHERVRNSYLRMARRAPKRIRLLDGTKPEEELEAEVRNMVDELLSKKGIDRR
jgi:dTMP kinase